MDIRDLNFKYCKVEQYGSVIYFKLDERELYYIDGIWIVEYRGETVKVYEDCYIFDMSDRIRFTDYDDIKEITKEEFEDSKAHIIDLIIKRQ
jgi:hypothetical protein